MCAAADSQMDFALRDSHLAGAVAHVLVEYFNKKQTQVGCCRSCCPRWPSCPYLLLLLVLLLPLNVV